MTRRIRSARRSFLLLLSAFPLAACAGMAPLGDVLGGLPGSEVSGEVRRVDERRREIRVRTYAGERTVEYDGRTRVLYRRESYPVRALEPGDEVSMRVRRGSRGDLYADQIRVERSARDRRGARDRDRGRDHDRARARVATLQGTVGRVDRRGGWFELREGRRETYRVVLPRRPGDSTRERFLRLRSGDRVRVEGTMVDRGRVELRRFR